MARLGGALSPEGEVLINGLAWDSDAALELVQAAAGRDAWLEPAPAEHRFDILPLLVTTDSAVVAFGRDIRRLRPNLLIGGVEEWTRPPLADCRGYSPSRLSGFSAAPTERRSTPTGHLTPARGGCE